MLLDFGVILKAGLLVGGIWWCKEIFSRFRSDIDEFKSSQDNTKRGVIIFFWLVTAAILFLVVNFIWGLLSNIIGAFR